MKRLPRWFVENDPSWQKMVNTESGLLKWTKKGTDIQAVCLPTSIYCEITGSEPDNSAGLMDLYGTISRYNRQEELSCGDIKQYLSSRYLNPRINSPGNLEINKDKLKRFPRI